MPNFQNCVPENVGTFFFVDSECIGCDTCGNIAPNHFKLTSDSDHAYIYLQPIKPNEIGLCNKALDECPVAAIGINKNGHS